MRYSKSTGGFYPTDIYGSPRMFIADPDWKRPTTTVVLQPGEGYLIGDQWMANTGSEPMALHDVPDMDAEAPTIEVDNPAYMVPDDAREITLERHAELLAGQATGKRIEGDADGYPVLVDPPAVVVTAAGLCAEIDTAADTARRAVAGDPLRTEEYKLAVGEAQAFKDAAYPADAVPRTVSAWAINGRTAQQAADSILAEAAQYTEALYLIRETRLQAKELVRAAIDQGNAEQAQDIAAETIASIQAAIAGIGNNAG